MRPLQIAVDGPAGAGKSSVARLVAERLGLSHVDSGATYRLVALEALRSGTDLGDGAAAAVVAEAVAADCSIEGGKLTFRGSPVGPEIRTAEVTEAASKVAQLPAVRERLVVLQRRLAGEGGVVMEGRDIGTVVLPSATVKVFLDADPATRARRRAGELGEHAEADVAAAQAERDTRDAARDVSPMVPASDATVIDTTSLTVQDAAERVLALVEASAQVPARADSPIVAVPAAPPNNAYRGLRAVLTFLFRALFRLETTGADKIPATGPLIIAANHRSLLDIPLVALPTRRMVWFMGKEELFRSKLGNWFFTLFGGFPVRRGRPDRAALGRALSLLRSGEIVGVFPEGTRTPDARFDRIEDGLVYLALKTGATIVPVALSGSEAVFPRDRRLPALVKIRILVGDPFNLGGPVEGVLPRSRIRAATESAQARLREVIDTLETR